MPAFTGCAVGTATKSAELRLRVSYSDIFSMQMTTPSKTKSFHFLMCPSTPLRLAHRNAVCSGASRDSRL